MDRAHDLIDHFVTAFLLAELYDDSEAAATLSPDAAQFPGITYETTGFWLGPNRENLKMLDAMEHQ